MHQNFYNMTYKGYTIEPETDPWAIKAGGPIRFYPGDLMEADWTGDGWQSNVSSAESIEDAKRQIDEKES